MRIVVLDGHTANPGDLDWQPLSSLASTDIAVHDRTAPDEVPGRAAGAGAVLTNKVRLGAGEMAALPGLRYIGVLATGFNVVDVEAARRLGIAVTNVPAYSTDSVAQHVMALLLEWTNRVGDHARSVREGRWASCPDFSYTLAPLEELTGRTLGIVGFGAIGRRVAVLAGAFGMDVLVHTRTPRPAEGVRFCPLDELLAASDVVTLHCPLTPETERLIDTRRLGRMKRGAFLINTGRGPLVDEAALAAALAEGRLGGAALDVLDAEPPQPGHPLFAAPNCWITPHVAWASRAARQRLIAGAAANLAAFLAGHRLNRVD